MTDHYDNSQTFNAYKKILDKILIITLFETDFHDTHTPGPWERPVSRLILAHQRYWNQSIMCAAPRTTPHLPGNICAKSRRWTKSTRDGS